MKNFAAQGALKDFFGNFLIIWAVMRFDGIMITTEGFGAVFATDWKPVFLFAGINGAVFA